MREIELAKNIIKEEIEKDGLKVIRIFLFGSRAKGNYKENSDRDFYGVIDQKLHFLQKREITSRIRRRLAEQKIPDDIIIQAKDVVEERKNDVGYLTY